MLADALSQAKTVIAFTTSYIEINRILRVGEIAT
jgi:hypothetical protein